MRQLKITKQVTNRETASLDKYLQEIGKVELITAEEEVKLAIKIKSAVTIPIYSEDFLNCNLKLFSFKIILFVLNITVSKRRKNPKTKTRFTKFLYLSYLFSK